MAWFVMNNVYLHPLDQWSVTSITLQANHCGLWKSADHSFITHSFIKKSAGLLPAYNVITLASKILSPCYWPHSDIQCSYDFRVYLYAQVILGHSEWCKYNIRIKMVFWRGIWISNSFCDVWILCDGSGWLKKVWKSLSP